MNSEYSSGPVSAATMAMLRILLVGVGSYAVGKGWVAEGDVEGIVAGVLAIGAAGFGIYQTFRRQKKLVTAEKMVGPISERSTVV